jgi:hypothetical protein
LHEITGGQLVAIDGKTIDFRNLWLTEHSSAAQGDCAKLGNMA